jgi:3-hydroxyacyl-CoA dehydrogenase
MAAIKKECLTVADTGVAYFEDVDRAWSIFMAVSREFLPVWPHGLDRAGYRFDIEKVYHQSRATSVDAPPKFLTDKVENGELGLKAGKGSTPTLVQPLRRGLAADGKRAGSED